MVRSGTQRTEIVLFHSTQSVECAVVRTDVARFVARFGLGPKSALRPKAATRLESSKGSANDPKRTFTLFTELENTQGKCMLILSHTIGKK